MSVESMRRFVETTITTQLALTHPNVKIKYENVKFAPRPNDMYVAAYIIEGDSFQASLGNRFVERHVGIVQVDIMTPEGQGTSTRNILADRIGEIFRRLKATLVDGSYLQFRVPRATPLGNEGLYDRMAVSIAYYRDERYDQSV